MSKEPFWFFIVYGLLSKQKHLLGYSIIIAKHNRMIESPSTPYKSAFRLAAQFVVRIAETDFGFQGECTFMMY